MDNITTPPSITMIRILTRDRKLLRQIAASRGETLLATLSHIIEAEWQIVSLQDITRRCDRDATKREAISHVR